jgi:hypothetical protein
VLPLLVLAIGARTPVVPDRPVVCVAGDRAATDKLLAALKEGGHIDAREDDGLCSGLPVRVTTGSSGLALRIALRGEAIERQVGSPITAAALVESWTLGEHAFPAPDPTVLTRMPVGPPLLLTFALDLEGGAGSNGTSWYGLALSIGHPIGDFELGAMGRFSLSGYSAGSLFDSGTRLPTTPFLERDHTDDAELVFAMRKYIDLGPVQIAPEVGFGVGYSVLSATVIGIEPGVVHDRAWGFTPRLEGGLTVSAPLFGLFRGRVRASVATIPQDPSDLSGSTWAVFRLGLGLEYERLGSVRWDD